MTFGERFGLLDNRMLRIFAETKHELTLALWLAMGDRKATGWLEANGGIVLCIGQENERKFMTPLGAPEVVEDVWRWLLAHREKRDNHIAGFLLETNEWGEAFDDKASQVWTAGLCFVRQKDFYVSK